MTRRQRSTMADLVELGMTSWLVIALRTSRLAFAPLPLAARDRREVDRMAIEKADAWGESAFALMRASIDAQSRLGHALMRAALVPGAASWRAAADAGAHTMTALTEVGIRPYGRRSRANARRLSRG